MRYFWVNPYNRTLNWANKPPSQTKNVNFKTAFIDSITWQEPPSTRSFPPGPEHSILVHTPDRILKIVPTSWYDQDAWTRGLSLLLKRSDRSPSKSLRNSPVKGRGGGIGMDFLMEIKANEKKESADLESSIAESREEVRSGDLFAYACL